MIAALVAAGNASGRAPQMALAQPSPQSALAARVVKRVPALEQRVVAAINELRREHGLVPLRLNTKLAATARAHSLSMAEQGYFGHSSASPFAGRTGGENLAWASPGLSARLTLELWLKSPPHRRNLLRPAWRDIGVGGVHVQPAPGVFGGLAATIVTADFAVRRR